MLRDPLGYQMTNVIGTQNLLTHAHRHSIRQFVFASSSSVYGDCPRLPWREEQFFPSVRCPTRACPFHGDGPFPHANPKSGTE